MELNEGILILLGIISPLIVSFFTKSTMSTRAKQTVAFVVSLVLAVGIAAITGDATLVFSDANTFFESLIVAAPIIYALQQAVYTFIFKGTALDVKIKDDLGVKKDGRHEAGAAPVAPHADTDLGADNDGNNNV